MLLLQLLLIKIIALSVKEKCMYKKQDKGKLLPTCMDILRLRRQFVFVVTGVVILRVNWLPAVLNPSLN
jgi:hypothetical protein